jgi:3-hydroxyisobutyrate dehydrogenase
MSRVAVVGLGRMGGPIAARLLTAGHEVVVTNRTPARVDELVRRGARAVATPAEAVSAVDAVLVMVSDDDASRSVWLGPDGILSGAVPSGALALECSTLSHDWVLELATAVAARGLRYIDAPVTGLPDAAAGGTLTLLIGADPADLEAAGPLLTPLATTVEHFGPIGSGTSYKLMINLMGAIQIAAAAEGIALAERAGLNLDQVARVIASGQAASPQVVRNSRRMVSGGHDREIVFSGRLRHKDTDYGVRLAESLGVDAPFGRVALAGLDSLLELGLGDLNESSIIEVARRAPHER